MTFLELQDRWMERVNLSSDVARARGKNFLNERYRAVQTSCNLGRVRRGEVIFTLLEGASTIDTGTVSTVDGDITGVIKPLTVSVPALRRVLIEKTFDELKLLDPGGTVTGSPLFYAAVAYNAASCTLRFFPPADADYAIKVEGILVGTDMSADTDVPALPEDFHDLLIFGALADEYDHFDKPDRAQKQEKKYEARLSQLRYFIQKSIYQHRVQAGESAFPFWWWAWQSPWYVNAV